ncbi:hypothetical protein BS78_08G164400 [Paspalum vaginatum]|nr:hypothetical protein BS78_08G164400 [Paspalum vaginatum]
MEAAVVSVAHGAMASLLGKLGDLLADKYKLVKETRGHIMFLKAELESMHFFLKKISDTEEPDEQDKHWAKEVRELSYDIEDSINEYMLRIEYRSSSKPRGFKGFIIRSMSLLTTINTRHEIAKELEGLKSRVMEVSERRMRYRVENAVPKQSNTAIDLRLLALHADTAGLVGIMGPTDQLISLMDDKGSAAHHLKVLAIVGFGGLGKTTLANEIYRKQEGLFQYRAFVSLSQKPNIKKILRTILSQVGFKASQNTNMERWEEYELISTLQKFLLDKRYFIVVDDIWEALAWDIIRCALPENMSGSMSVSKYIYKMKPLSEQDSKRLFFKRIFGSEDACPPDLKVVSTGILKRCGGLPLAIITISSLLANQPTILRGQWEYIQNSLISNFEVNPSLDGMRHILNLSYINLPHHLKACMLYLGIYPEDHTIKKNALVRQWIAEGFISKVHGMDSEDMARSYFNEFINRSIIQPVDTRYDGEVMSCRVHDMMLDLILQKAREDNFITVINGVQDLVGQRDKIRRLSLNLDGAIDDRVAESVQISQIRMLARFGSSTYLPHILQFKHLRVLVIEISDGPLLDLNGICLLFQLRCIKIVAGGHGVVLPSKIVGLQQLETFEINAAIKSATGQSFPELPSDIVHLSRLLHLIIPHYVIFPDGIGNLKSLRTLRHFNLGNSPNCIRSLSELTDLTDLKISISGDKVVERGREVLRTCLEKLCNLKYLGVDFYYDGDYLDPLSTMPSSFCRLQRFHGYRFSSVPRWIRQLHNLNDLYLIVKEVLEDDIGMLAQLPSLAHLSLNIQGTTKDKIIIRRIGFPCLKRFTVGCSRVSCLTFEARAMAKLERLELYFNAHGWDRYGAAPTGIEHLSRLKEIYVYIGGARARESNIRAAESALWKAVDMHLGRPVAHIKIDVNGCYQVIVEDMDDEPGEEDLDGGTNSSNN